MTSVTINGEISGDVTGNPPNVATGDLDVEAVSIFGTFVGANWAISQDPSLGTASVDPASGVWTYTVDPAVFDSLDDGQVVGDTFEVTVTAFFETPGGATFNDTATQTISITIEGVCFTAGTLIGTPDGAQPVEALVPGDLVRTLDHGAQPVRWIEGNTISADKLRDKPGLRPVRIKAGSLGGGQPRRDLVVSQQHRILVHGPRVELLFGTPEVLLAAKHLCNWPGISIDEDCGTVDYFHILLDRHEILEAEGAPAESLYLGDEALYALTSGALQELADIFPDGVKAEGAGFGRAARMILRQHEAEALVPTTA